jgi:hypothetical protein
VMCPFPCVTNIFMKFIRAKLQFTALIKIYGSVGLDVLVVMFLCEWEGRCEGALLWGVRTKTPFTQAFCVARHRTANAARFVYPLDI